MAMTKGARGVTSQTKIAGEGGGRGPCLGLAGEALVLALQGASLLESQGRKEGVGEERERERRHCGK